MKVIFDCQCNKCLNIIENVYDEPGKDSYGECECGGNLEKRYASFNFMFNKPRTKEGKTKDGVRWKANLDVNYDYKPKKP
jgi:hypothetical protein